MTKNTLLNIPADKVFDEIQKLHQKIEQQGIQLSTIAAQMIEQNEKMNALTQQTEYIGVKELERSFDIKERSQKSYRGRIKNPLPYYQEVDNGKISYKVSEIKEWKSNQKVIRDI